MGSQRIQHRLLAALACCAVGAGCGDADPDHAGKPLSGHGKVQFLGPQFPGAGTGSAGYSIAAGIDTVTCDKPGPAPGGTTGPVPGAQSSELCFYADDPAVPAAMIEWVLEAAADTELVHVRLTFNPDFVDNTYGANAIGWGSAQAMNPAPGGAMMMPGMAKPPKGPKGHTFMDLVGSDHAEFQLYDANNALRMQFKLDYLSQTNTAPSGYACLGVTGGEGKMLVGSAADVVAASSSLDRNLNACMFGSYLEDSPATDADYTPNPNASTWDFRVVYDVWVKRAVFGDAGFGRGIVSFVHASPSKVGENTVNVTPRDCPPSWPYCQDPDGCPPACPIDGCQPSKPQPEPDAGSGWLDDVH
ncbi:MAG: hypothetical protein QM778_34550 [Myxococcales bacterium]